MSLSRKDIEELKPAIERCAQKVIGSDDPTVVSAALSCLDKGYEKKKTILKLTSLMKESLASQFADRVFTVYKDYLNISEVSKKMKRKVTEDSTNEIKQENKKPKLINVVNNSNDNNNSNNSLPATNSVDEFTPDKIKEMMANAQKMIQERKNQLNFTMPQQTFPPAPPAGLPQHEAFAVDANEKMKKANELQARIQAKLATVGLNNVVVPIPNSVGTGPSQVIMDEHGRTIDPLTGQAIQLQHHTPTLKANIRAKKREQFKAVQEKPPEEMSHSKFFDFRLSGNKAAFRNRKTLKFYEPGKFEKIGQRMRTKAQLEKLNYEISLAAKKTGIASAAKLAIIQPKKECPDEVPDVEWWDAVILEDESSYPDVSEFLSVEQMSSSAAQLPLAFENITHLVEHPIQMKPPGKSDKPVGIAVMLTKKENKKLRKQNRSEVQKEIQEKIRLGLMPPPEPKVRMANLMRVLGTEAVSDPTRVEAHVRAQMAKRQKAHEDANAARKLTKEQKRQKKIKKIKEDTSCGVVVSVYRVGDLSSQAKKFKIEANANQLFMTGIVVLHKDCNVIVVEGGPKQQRKFRRLLMNRIKWTDDRKKNANDDDDDDDEDDNPKSDECKLIWEGMVRNRSFGEIKFKTCPTEAYAKEQFRKHGVEHYWDLSFSSTILETTMP